MNLPSWIAENEIVFAWLVAASLATFLISLIAVPLVIIWMSTDYFVRVERSGVPRTPLRIFGRALKNLLGISFLIAGIAMLVLPGQGILTMLIGLSLVNFPGKRGLELRLIRLSGVRRSIAWLRRKAKKEPLQIPNDEPE